jgi:hypothetical protein
LRNQLKINTKPGEIFTHLTITLTQGLEYQVLGITFSLIVQSKVDLDCIVFRSAVVYTHTTTGD